MAKAKKGIGLPFYGPLFEWAATEKRRELGQMATPAPHLYGPLFEHARRLKEPTSMPTPHSPDVKTALKQLGAVMEDPGNRSEPWSKRDTRANVGKLQLLPPPLYKGVEELQAIQKAEQDLVYQQVGKKNLLEAYTHRDVKRPEGIGRDNAYWRAYEMAEQAANKGSLPMRWSWRPRNLIRIGEDWDVQGQVSSWSIDFDGAGGAEVVVRPMFPKRANVEDFDELIFKEKMKFFPKEMGVRDKAVVSRGLPSDAAIERMLRRKREQDSLNMRQAIARRSTKGLVEEKLVEVGEGKKAKKVMTRVMPNRLKDMSAGLDSGQIKMTKEQVKDFQLSREQQKSLDAMLDEHIKAFGAEPSPERMAKYGEIAVGMNPTALDRKEREIKRLQDKLDEGRSLTKKEMLRYVDLTEERPDIVRKVRMDRDMRDLRPVAPRERPSLRGKSKKAHAAAYVKGMTAGYKSPGAAKQLLDLMHQGDFAFDMLLMEAALEQPEVRGAIIQGQRSKTPISLRWEDMPAEVRDRAAGRAFELVNARRKMWRHARFGMSPGTFVQRVVGEMSDDTFWKYNQVRGLVNSADDLKAKMTFAVTQYEKGVIDEPTMLKQMEDAKDNLVRLGHREWWPNKRLAAAQAAKGRFKMPDLKRLQLGQLVASGVAGAVPKMLPKSGMAERLNELRAHLKSLKDAT